MNLSYLIVANTLGILALVFLTIIIRGNFQIKKQFKADYLLIALANFILIILDALEYTISYSSFPGQEIVHNIVVTMCYCFNPILTFLFIYAFRSNKKIVKTSAFLVLVNALFQIISLIFICINHLEHTSVLWQITRYVQLTIDCFFVILIAYFITTKLKLLSKNDRLFIWTIFAIAALAFGVEVFANVRFILWNDVALTLIVYYMYLQNLDMKFDSLTGLANRYVFEQDLAHRLNDVKITIIVFDINNLKIVNDTQGHVAGDDLLKYCASMINKCFMKGTCYRIGGDEFVFISKKELMADDYHVMAEAFKSELEKPNLISFGMSVSSKEQDLMESFKVADNEMYAQKKLDKKSV